MIMKLVVVVVVLVAALLAYAATRPDTFRLERATSIKAAPEQIFALVNDLHQWQAWSPWEKSDPQLKRTYSGAAGGTGAGYAWVGNREVGAGSMQIVEAVPPVRLLLKLDFSAPFEAHNMVEFRFERQGDLTRVTQAMYGPSPYISKLMGLVFSMDKMVGGKFEEGLANLKALAEK